MTSADEFFALHAQPQPLILANVWDAGTARITERLGAKAIATSSAALAWAHGYPDGSALPRELLVRSAADIARAVKRPVTIDCEGGWSDDPSAVADLAARLIDAGVVGCNLEDGHADPHLLCAKIEAVKARAAKLGTRFFVNARTDVWLFRLTPKHNALETAIARAREYVRAGADGVFAPVLRQQDEIEAMVQAIDKPLNIMAWKGIPNAPALAAMGVRRISSATLLSRVALGAMRSAAADWLRTGDTASLSARADLDTNFDEMFAQPHP